jgi:hypothetical protein
MLVMLLNMEIHALIKVKVLAVSLVLEGLQLMWLSGRPMLLVAEVRGSIPANHRGWSRR